MPSSPLPLQETSKLACDDHLPYGSDAAGDHCLLPGRRYSYVPQKLRAEYSLPPMRLARTQSDGSGLACGGQRNSSAHPAVLVGKRTRNLGWSRSAGSGKPAWKSYAELGGKTWRCYGTCHGDYCDTSFRYPATLRNLEISQDPWTAEAKELCTRTVDARGSTLSPAELAAPLLLQEELVACAPAPAPHSKEQQKGYCSSTCGVAGSICASWIVMARAHPSLCRWLEDELGWMFDPLDANLVTEAAARITEDDGGGGGPPDMRAPTTNSRPFMLHGLQHSPVCRACMCVYSLIHSIVRMVRVQRRDLWASRVQRRRRALEECEKSEQLESCLRRMRREQSDGTRRLKPRSNNASSIVFDPKSKGGVSTVPKSAFLDNEMRAWLHSTFDDRGGSASP